MWQIYALMAQDIARERMREAQAVAMARRADEHRAAEERAHGRHAYRASTPRRLVASGLRSVEAGAGSLARTARVMAARVDGPAA